MIYSVLPCHVSCRATTEEINQVGYICKQVTGVQLALTRDEANAPKCRLVLSTARLHMVKVQGGR